MNSEPIVEPRRPAWEALLVFAGAAATYGVTAALTIRPAAVSALANVQAGEPGTPYEFVVSEAQAVLGTSPYWSAVVLSVIAAALAAAAAANGPKRVPNPPPPRRTGTPPSILLPLRAPGY